MNKNKKYNILQIGLLALLLSGLGINPCYADDPAEIMNISCDASNDQAIGISPDVFPKGAGVKLLTIKNNYPQEIEITGIRDANGAQKYVTPFKLPEPLKIPPGGTHVFELQPGVCPAGSAKEASARFIFSYRTTINGNPVDKEFSFVVGVSCHRELERAIEARDAALKTLEIVKAEKIAVIRDRDAALKTVETLKSEKTTLMAEKEKAINALLETHKNAIAKELEELQTLCEKECNKAINQTCTICKKKIK